MTTKNNAALRPVVRRSPKKIMKETKKSESNSGTQDQTGGFFEKAQKMTTVYTQATGCGICVYDQNCVPLKGACESPLEKNICPYCIKYRQTLTGALAAGETSADNTPADFQSTDGTSTDFQSTDSMLSAEPCHEIHLDAIKESGSHGGTRIYNCKLGFMFWASPIYSDGRFTGALRGGAYLKDNDEDPLDKKSAFFCNGGIPAEEFAKRLAAFPRGGDEKIKSLAEMLLICAEFLSSGSEDYHEILRCRAEQQRVLSVMIEDLKNKYPAGSALPGYPLDKERLLIAALGRGDSNAARNILNEVLALLIFSNPNHFRYIQLRAIELVVLLFRTDINPGQSGQAALEANNRSLKQVQEAKTIEELTDLLHGIVKRIAGQISSFQGIRHGAALRKAEHFIRENFTRKVSLEEIATVAGLSAPYFSTIFKEEMGENLSKYLNRLRVERASRLLLETDLPLSEIAGACCFEDQSWFSKIFKAYTGISPGKYRSQGGGMIREISEDNLSEDYLKTIT